MSPVLELRLGDSRRHAEGRALALAEWCVRSGAFREVRLRLPADRATQLAAGTEVQVLGREADAGGPANEWLLDADADEWESLTADLRGGRNLESWWAREAPPVRVLLDRLPGPAESRSLQSFARAGRAIYAGELAWLPTPERREWARANLHCGGAFGVHARPEDPADRREELRAAWQTDPEELLVLATTPGRTGSAGPKLPGARLLDLAETPPDLRETLAAVDGILLEGPLALHFDATSVDLPTVALLADRPREEPRRVLAERRGVEPLSPSPRTEDLVQAFARSRARPRGVERGLRPSISPAIGVQEQRRRAAALALAVSRPS